LISHWEVLLVKKYLYLLVILVNFMIGKLRSTKMTVKMKDTSIPVTNHNGIK
jgi:hypothetical protein